MTPTCEPCKERLLDFVYGLLEKSEIQELREHLTVCASCQAALLQAQAEQKLLASAARAIRHVPEFSLPTDQLVPQDLDTLPLVPRPTSKRSMWRRPWIAWSGAAVVLIAIAGSVSTYRHERHVRQVNLASARHVQKDIEQQIVAMPAVYESLHQSKLQELRVNTGSYLHVVGPTALLPHAKAPVHITTRHIEGDLAISNLRVKLVEPETGTVLHLARLDSGGLARTDLDVSQAKPDSLLDLIVEANTSLGVARLKQTVRVQGPSYVSRLDTNKNAYQIRDVLFFRVLVLDRYSLTPPDQPIKMRAALQNPAGQMATFVDLPTGVGGILAGELPIAEDFAAGAYTLHVSALDQANVQTASQVLEIVRELPGIRLYQNRYRLGGVITGEVLLPRGSAPQVKGQFGSDKPVDVTLQPQAGAAPAGFGGGAGERKNAADAKADKAGADADVYSFAMPLPSNLPLGTNRLPLNLQLLNGKKFSTNVTLEPNEFAIDFFPEGGDLIAGVKNRVFYRVRANTGEPVTDDGRVILLANKNEIVDSRYHLGLGYFDLTPDVNEAYAVRIVTPMKVVEVAKPFANLRRDGVVLHVPKAVGNEGDPIGLVMTQQGPTRRLLLLAQCRGQIVDERTIDVKSGSVQVTLQPPPDTHGIIRVTAYEVVGNQLQPVAERLVYRASSARLDVGFALNPPQLQPGLKNVLAKISAADEKGQPASAWILASIVDERFQPRPSSLAAHFLLLNDIRSGADLDNAQIVLNDSPGSVQMLERFLGTHGWRRFVPADEPLAMARADDGPQSSQPLIFSRENAPLEQLQEKYLEQRTLALKPLHEEAFQKESDLADLRVNASQAMLIAQRELADFDTTIQLCIGVTLSIALVLLFISSLILMALGIYRMTRVHKLATPVFGGAFACLALCLGILMLGKSLGSHESMTPGLLHPDVAGGGRVQKLLDDVFAQGPKLQRVDERPLTGMYALVPLKNAERELQNAAKAETKRGSVQLGSVTRDALLHEQAAQAFADRDRQGPAAFAGMQKNQDAADALNRRYEQARQAAQVLPQTVAGGPSPVPAPGATPALKSAMKVKAFAAPAPMAMRMSVPQQPTKAADGSKRSLEYAHQHVPNLQADTLLWHPNLWLKSGNAEVRFDIADGQATYRVLLLGHDRTGRFGFYETRLHVR